MPASRTLRVTLPIPSGQLGPNGRAHWRKKHALFQQYKQYAYVEMLCLFTVQDVEPPHWAGTVWVDLTWQVSSRAHIPDVDNALARCKAYLDAGQAAGIYKDDRQVQMRSIIRRVGKPSQVELTFECTDGPHGGQGDAGDD